MANSDTQLAVQGETPSNSDFAFYIDFQNGSGSPSRVFSATSEFIRACEKLDRELVKSIDEKIETVTILEDIEVSSLKTWLRHVLKSADDESLKTLDWKPAVGKFLLKAKYSILKWVDSDGSKSLPDLAKEIQQHASDTDLRRLPDYVPPSPKVLIAAIIDFQTVKECLSNGDVASFMTNEGSLVLDLNKRLNPDELENLEVNEAVKQPQSTIIFAVKKPDYIGESKWSLRHGKKTIQSKIADESWLRKFQNREIDVRPGDALRCLVDIEHLYGFDNELISERYTVVEVMEVIPNRFSQGDLFSD